MEGIRPKMKMMERKAYTAFGETGFGEMGFGETGRYRNTN